MHIEYLTFTVGHLYFGIPTTGVLEINKNLEITPVPGSGKSVKGLINLRGQLVTAMDMHQYLGIEPEKDSSASISVIVNIAGQLVCLLVDAVIDILPLHELTFEPTPMHLTDDSKKLILGGHKLSGKLLLVLDYEKIIPATSHVKHLSMTN